MINPGEISSNKQDYNVSFRRWFRGISFLIVGTALFLLLQRLFLPKWNHPSMPENLTYSLETFFAQENNTDEVIFLGSSHMEYGFSPMQFYDQHGVVSYNLGLSAERLSGAFYLLREALKTQKPKVIVLDASDLFLEDTAESQWRYIMDNMGNIGTKISMAEGYSRFKTGSEEHRVPDALVPLLLYHSRWKNLSETDFRDFAKKKDYYAAGYFLSTDCIGSGQTLDNMNSVTEMLQEDTVRTQIRYENGQEIVSEEEDPLYEALISDENIQWLNKIISLCQESGTELLLTKIPSIMYPITYESAWTRIRSSAVKQFAEQNGLTFWDILYDTDINIDIDHDFADGGRHLNYLGARKVTDYLGAYLVSHYDLEPKENDAFSSSLLLYDQVTQMAMMQLEQDMDRYLDWLDRYKEECMIILCVSEDAVNGLGESQRKSLKKLGLSAVFGEAPKSEEAYLALIDSGKVIYEASSNRQLEYHRQLGPALDVSVISTGRKTGKKASVLIGGQEYAVNSAGLNIVVYDKKTEEVVDSVVFNTGEDSPYPCKHKDSQTYINQYGLALYRS